MNILDHGDEIIGLSFRRAHQRQRRTGPYDFPILANVAFFYRRRLPRVGQQLLSTVRGRLNIVVIGNLRAPFAEQLFLVVAEDFAIFSVHPEEPPVRLYQRDAGRRLIEGGFKTALRRGPRAMQARESLAD